MRKWIVAVIFCWFAVFSAHSDGAEIIGLVLDFPSGSLDSVTKIELHINRSPSPLGNTDGYTNMQCDKNNPNDICPGYKDVGGGNYIQYYYPSYTGTAFPGGLGTDWLQRTKWTTSSPKITYMGGTDTLESGIIDGYYYQTHPEVTDVVLTGYPGKTKASFFYTGHNVNYLFASYKVYEILVEDDWDLADAVMALQIMVGIEPPATEYGLFDINADGKIGMAEGIYILQKISGRQ